MKISQKIGFLLMVCLYVTSISCERLTNDLPSADFSVSPLIGDLETIFLFDAGEVLDEETEAWRLKVRWDADSDGSWDSEYSVEKRFAYRFSSEGEHHMTLEVLDSYGGVTQIKKTVFVTPIIQDSILTDVRDNQDYKIVKLWGKWYMAENLRYGSLLTINNFPADNAVTEAYNYPYDATKSDLYGYFYTWNEASDYRRNVEQGICPDGWHIFTIDDFLELKSILRKINNKGDFVGENGCLHLNLPLSGRYYYPAGDWDQQEDYGYCWMNQELPFDKFNVWVIWDGADTIDRRSEYYSVAWVNEWKNEWGEFNYSKIALPIRCIKD